MNIFNQAFVLLLFFGAILDLSFSFLPVEGKKRITLVTFSSICSNARNLIRRAV